MNKRATIIDYGSGNLLSVKRSVEYCGAVAKLSADPFEIEDAERLVLPGVGAFADGVQGLRDRGLVEPILRFAASGRPLLGICLGMQMLASFSDEFGRHEGLGLIPGGVKAIPRTDVDGRPLRVPHIGWSALHRSIKASWDDTPLATTMEGTYVYLVHSYAVIPDAAQDRLTECVYGGHRICTAIGRGRVWGFQFHPEKSGPAGLEILGQFLEI